MEVKCYDMVREGSSKRGVMFESIVNVKKKMITQIRRDSQRREQSEIPRSARDDGDNRIMD
jgi:hypothetical protein